MNEVFADRARRAKPRADVLIFVLLLVLMLPFSLAPAARAELVLYRIPNTRTVVTLQGKVTVNPGRTVSFRHTKFGTLVFGLEDVTIYKVPTIESIYARMVGRAAGRRDAPAVVEAANYALKHGMLKEFYAAIDKLLEIDPDSKPGRRVRSLQQKMDQPLGESNDEEMKLRKLIGLADMKIKKSKHFILLHDTPERPGKNRNKLRADERLDLLEAVYETFLLKFHLYDVNLEVPRERLMVVLFAQQKDYLRFVDTLSPRLRSAAGFWSPTINVGVFFDQGTGEGFASLNQLSSKMEALKKEALRVTTPQTKDIVRMSNTISLLIQLTREDQDIQVVSHEATHQMAGNTGLLPRNVSIPIWVHEGLATYFEAPKDATWSGIGAVNEERLRSYRALEKDRAHSNLDFIIQDKIFTQAADQGSRLHAYGQAWALTHFMMEKHFDQLVAYYRSLARQPEGMPIPPARMLDLFRIALDKDYPDIDAQWRAYMGSLETDVETILQKEAK